MNTTCHLVEIHSACRRQHTIFDVPKNFQTHTLIHSPNARIHRHNGRWVEHIGNFASIHIHAEGSDPFSVVLVRDGEKRSRALIWVCMCVDVCVPDSLCVCVRTSQNDVLRLTGSQQPCFSYTVRNARFSLIHFSLPFSRFILAFFRSVCMYLWRKINGVSRKSTPKLIQSIHF